MKRAAKLGRILRRPGFWRGLLTGTYAAVEHEAVLGNLDLASAVDVGANRGQFSLVLTELMPSIRIYAFEPLGRPAAAFRRLFANSSTVMLYQEAVGPTEMTVPMQVSRHDDSSSLLPPSALQTDLFPGTETVGEESVHMVALDQRLTVGDLVQPSLLKLDVQGYELMALRGCETLLANFAYVYLEISFRELYKGQTLAVELIRFLCDREFDLTGIYNVVYDSRGLAIQADCMFERKKSEP